MHPNMKAICKMLKDNRKQQYAHSLNMQQRRADYF